jgi:hypothetical protein
MYRSIYLEQREWTRYDDNRILAYLNEEVVDDFIPTDAPTDFAARTGYAYTGTMSDGGTLIDASDNSRNVMINGIIRTQYSQSEEDAIKTHQILFLSGLAGEKEQEYKDEFATFNAWRQYAINEVSKRVPSES